MKRAIIGLMAAVLLILPAISAAQKQGGEQGEHKAKMSKMHTNMGEMANMMNKMSQMMSKGKMTPEQQEKCAVVMKQMSQMMKEMSVPHGKQVQEKHQKELQEIEREINPLFNHLVQPG
jgi:membrane-bound lytic murein transglycosylase B